MLYRQLHYKIYKVGPFRTSEIEIQDLFKAWIAISTAFAIVLGGVSVSSLFTYKFLFNFLLAAFTVGIGFLFHEMGHKITAQHYGCFAEFRSFDIMLVLALFMSFFGFVFAAPGAVMIAGHVDRKRNGVISLAGPLVNILLAILFIALNFAVQTNTEYLKNIFSYGFMINSWLALFNMIPFWNFDGIKILRWSKLAYIVMVVVSAALLFVINI